MITDEQKDVLILQYYDRGILKKEIRSYEVSLWTLLDEFITVLKWSDVEQKGRIELPKMTLNIDGTLNFTFSIPMYYRIYASPDPKYAKSGQLVENPNWYNTLNNNLMTGLRKLKVIFNKGTEYEEVYEFVIIKVTENHEKDIMTCNIESEGLAFLELGKIGYKISLSLANFELIYKQWEENGYWFNKDDRKSSWLLLKVVTTDPSEVEPDEAASDILYIYKLENVDKYGCYLYNSKLTSNNHMEFTCYAMATLPILSLDYWCKEAGLEKYNSNVLLDSRKWYYDVLMNWNSFDNTDASNLRSSDKLYEEPYTSSWNNDLTPAATETYREKARAVETDKSNLYNITLTIAEKFEIFCRYKYLYDENYHIIGRVIIFYNNFMQENPSETIGFLYPYSLSKVERSMDGTDVTTKLYVLDTDDVMNITNAPVNDMQEDYLLNFDYLYLIGAISLELYDAILPYKILMRELNQEIFTLQDRVNSYLIQIPELEGKLTVANNSITLDKELIAANNKYLLDLTSHNPTQEPLYVEVVAANADYFQLITNEAGSKYINLLNTNKGIVEDTIKIFLTFGSGSGGAFLDNEVFKYTIDHDDYNNLKSITFNDMSEFGISKLINWTKVCEDFYMPKEYRGNVNLAYRLIVPAEKFITAGYDEFDGTYGTLYTDTYTSSYYDEEKGEMITLSGDGKFYDILYTCILADGTVLGSTAIEEYLEKIIVYGLTPQEWMASDKKDKKLFLEYIEVPDLNDHQASDSYADNLHTMQASWDYVRFLHDWFGHNSNPDGVLMAEVAPIHEETDLEDYTTTLDPAVPVTHVYLTYKYDPLLYYQKIAKVWSDKLKNDTEEYKEYTKLLGPKSVSDKKYDIDVYTDGTTVSLAYAKGLNKLLNDAQEELNEKITEKEAVIKAFEHLMGPALREGYWLPENYNDYGDRHLYNGPLTTNDITADVGNDAIIAWDSKLFDDEDKLYYESSILQNKVYYPCIDLISVFGSANAIPKNLEEYSVAWLTMNLGDSEVWTDALAKDTLILAVKSKALIRFIKINLEIKPVLVLVGTKSFSDDELEKLLINQNARLELYSAEVDNEGNVDIDHGETLYYIRDDANNKNSWITVTDETLEANIPEMVFPRIKFSSLALKTDAKNLTIHYNTILLEMFEDYRVNTRNTERTIDNEKYYYPEYYITIKPDILIKYGLNLNFEIKYVFSNSNTEIYLDALLVLKENAYPKVEYSVSVNALDVKLLHSLYTLLARIVMINDNDLKFENVFGYISLLDLDLDNCANDTIEVKNYKTKFEDLFSTIVAQTEALKRSGAGLTTALSGGIPLSEDGFIDTIERHWDIFSAYLDSHFDSSQVVKDRLAELFEEASKILSDSNKTLNLMQALTEKNASILAGFAENVLDQLTVKVFRLPTRPDKFNSGDIWLLTDENDNVLGRYMAVMSSANLSGESSNSTRGFVRTYDGSLASITGAAINIDANAGTIDIEAQNLINIKSGNDIYIAANEKVDIVGNKLVNIGGTQINLCSLYEKEVNEDGLLVYKLDEHEERILHETTGINLVAGMYRADEDYGETSRILISPVRIEMGASKLELKAASLINLVTSNGETAHTSAVHVSAEDGIWIGTGTSQGVRLFGGEVKLNDDGSVNTSVTSAAGASVELNALHLILGYANTSNNTATAIELTEKHVIIAAGGNLDCTPWEKDHSYNVGDTVVYNDNHYKCKTAHTSTSWSSSKWTQIDNITGTSSGLVGAKFTNNSIGFATLTGAGTLNDPYVYGAFIMNEKGLTLGSTDGTKDLANTTSSVLKEYFANANHGSYVRVSPEGIELGSLADLYINTDNFKLLTHSQDKDDNNSAFVDGETIMAVGNNLLTIGYETKYDPTTGKWTEPDQNGDYQEMTFAKGLPLVRLLVNKEGLYIEGTVYAAAGSFTGSVTATSFILLDNNAYKIEKKYKLSTSCTVLPTSGYGSYPSSADITAFHTAHPDDEMYIWTLVTIKIGGKSLNASYSCKHINEDGNETNILVDYAVNSSAEVPDNVSWVTFSEAEEDLGTDNCFLITRTRTFIGYTFNTTYTFSKMVDDNLPYVISIKTLYWLKTNSTNPTDYSDYLTVNHSEVTRTSDVVNLWTLTVPTYTGTNSTYYTCEQKKWANHTPALEWTAPVINHGLTVANLTATAASGAAADAAHAADPIMGYGVVGYDEEMEETTAPNNVKDGVEYDQNGYPTWNGDSYGLILGNNLPLPMLIGGNDGVTIIDTNGASGNGSSVVLKGGGIALHGSTINFTTVGSNTSALALGNTGIIMGTSGNITLLSKNFILNSTVADNDTTSSIFELKKKASDWTALNDKYDTALKYTNSGLEVTGKITATELTIGGKPAAQFVAENSTGTDTSEFVTYADFHVGLHDTYLNIPASISASVWNTVGGGTNVKITDTSLKVGVFSSGTLTSGLTLDTNGLYASGGYIKFDSTAVIPQTYLEFTYSGNGTDPRWLSDDGGWWFLSDINNSSSWIHDGWIKYNNSYYYCLSDGYIILHDSLTLGNITYYFNSSGVLITPHIYIDKDGIDMAGPRLKMNGKDAWGRDDIIIMKNTDNLALIENSMIGIHDWVLIKPYYNAEIVYTYHNWGTVVESEKGTNVLYLGGDTYTLNLTSTNEQLAFGSNASWYEYELYFEIATSLVFDSFSIDVTLTSSNQLSLKFFTFVSDGNKYLGVGRVAAEGKEITCNSRTDAMATEYGNGTNFCTEGALLTLTLHTINGVSARVTNIRVTARCDATTSRVPCTVYYYP